MKRLALTVVLPLLAILLLATGCLSHHQGPLPGEPSDDAYAEIGDTRMHYVDVGEGPAVVMIHGFASSLDTWAAIIPELAKDHRVLAMDLKGFGWTDRPEGDYSPQAQADLVLELMDQRGIEKAALVGHSWGSSVALALALRAPERVTRIALYDAWVYHEQLPPFFVWSRAPVIGEMLFSLFYRERPADKAVLAFHDPDRVTQELVDEIERDLALPGATAAALAAVRGQNYESLQKRYGEIEQPTLLLWGREDIVTHLEVGQRLYRQLPNAELVVFPQCGHFPMIEAYHPSTNALTAFLDDTRRPSGMDAEGPK